MEVRRKLDARCLNDLCLQSPDEADVARGAERTAASFVKSPKLNRERDPVENLARRLVAELNDETDGRHMWIMLAVLERRMHVSWEDVEAAAKFANSKKWVRHQMYSVILDEPGQRILEEGRRSPHR